MQNIKRISFLILITLPFGAKSQQKFRMIASSFTQFLSSGEIYYDSSATTFNALQYSYIDSLKLNVFNTDYNTIEYSHGYKDSIFYFFRQECFLNSNGLKESIQSSIKKPYNSNWTNYSKDFFVYYPDGLIKNYDYYYWDTLQLKFEIQDSYIYKYWKSGNDSIKTVVTYDNNSMDSVSRTYIYFDQMNHTKSVKDQSYSGNGNWDDWMEELYYYNAKGQWDSVVTYIFPKTRKEATYYSFNNNKLNEVLQISWDESKLNYTNYTKTSFRYNGSGQNERILKLYWNKVNLNWDSTELYTFENVNTSEIISYYGYKKTWKLWQRDSIHRNSNNLPDTRYHYIANYAGGPLAFVNENHYYYEGTSGMNSTNSNLNYINIIFPNPGRSVLNIQTPEQNSIIYVIDMQGKLMYSGSSKEKITTIETDNWAKGMYFVNGSIWIKE